MKFTPILTAVAAASALLVSCGKDNKSHLSVPKDAAVVVHVSPASLSSKLSWSEIKASSWFRDMYANVNDSFARKMLDNPEVSGIDSQSEFVFFIKKQGRGGYGVLEGTIKDESAFQDFLKKSPTGSSIKQEGEWWYMTSADGSVAAWNKSRFAVIMDIPSLGAATAGTYASYQDASLPVDSLKKYVTSTLTLESSNSLTSDNRFSEMMEQKGDMHLWMNSEKLYSGMLGGALSMMRLNTLLEGNVSASTMSFEEGKITMKSKQYYGKEITELMKKYDIKPVDAALFNRIPSQNVVGAFAMNCSPEQMKEFIKLAGFDGVMNSFLGRYNYTLDDLTAAYKGELVLALTDLVVKQEKVTVEGSDYTYNTTSPDMTVLFGMSIKDKAFFDKMVDAGRQELIKEGGEAALAKVAFKTSNDWFVISNKMEAVDKFLAGGNNNQAFTAKLKGHSFGMYVDIQRVMKSLQPMVSEDNSTAAMNASLKLWEDVVMTGGSFKDGIVTSEMEINFVDKKTNALKQINQYIEQLAAIRKNMATHIQPSTDSMPMDGTTLPTIDSSAFAQ